MWATAKKNGVVIHFLVQPNSPRTEIVGPFGDPPRLKIKISAPPVEGAANEELISFCRKKLKVPKSSLAIIVGETSRMKDVFCEGADLAEIRAKLSAPK